jgi:hypothetical protein
MTDAQGATLIIHVHQEIIKAIPADSFGGRISG